MQRRIWLVVWALLALLGIFTPGAAQGEGRQVLVLTSSGALRPPCWNICSAASGWRRTREPRR